MESTTAPLLPSQIFDTLDRIMKSLIYKRMTTTPKTTMRRMKPEVMKKLILRSGNKSVSRIPFVFRMGEIALNSITDVIISNPITSSFINHDANEPDDTENGVTKNKMTKSNDAPKRIHEYFVFSLY